jgi:hypothetical protein
MCIITDTPGRKYAIEQDVSPVVPYRIEFGVDAQQACSEIESLFRPVSALLLSYGWFRGIELVCFDTHSGKDILRQGEILFEFSLLAFLPCLDGFTALTNAFDTMLEDASENC